MITDKILYKARDILVASKFDDMVVMNAILYLLQSRLEHMQAQFGYAETIDNEKVSAWHDGNLVEMNRLEWIGNTKEEILACQEVIAGLEKILRQNKKGGDRDWDLYQIT